MEKDLDDEIKLTEKEIQINTLFHIRDDEINSLWLIFSNLYRIQGHENFSEIDANLWAEITVFLSDQKNLKLKNKI